jgi:hypothetical protein
MHRESITGPSATPDSKIAVFFERGNLAIGV